jgi:hypothetical protein
VRADLNRASLARLLHGADPDTELNRDLAHPILGDDT